MKSLAKQTHGFIMPVLLITIFFVMTMITAVSSFSITSYRLATRASYIVNAQLAADAGLDVGINELNIDPNWTGSGGETEVLNTAKLRTTYETQLLNGATDNDKVLSVVARSYSPSSATEPKTTRRYELDLRAVTSGVGASSVVSGVGGLVLNGNAKITGGDVVVNGFVSMANNSQIGTQTNAVNVRVAHQTCPQPPNASYPQVCTSGEPINMGINAKIYGEVHATNQTNGTNMFDPGLIVGQSAPPLVLPEYDRSVHAGATAYAPTSSVVACPKNGSVTWPANIKITGDFVLGSKCELTITGNVWITGSLSTGNNSRILVSNTLSTTRPVIMVDGANGFVFENNGQIVPNSSSTGIELRTFWSHASSGCSPICSGLTGAGLANSQNVTTIDLSNNGDAANSVFIAQWSRVYVSNNGALGAVAGQSIELGNNAIINFSASVPGSDNLTKTWVQRGYMRVYD